jgi:hypothetical protein
MSPDTAWNDILKKEATGIDDCDLGRGSADSGRIYCYRKR